MGREYFWKNLILLTLIFGSILCNDEHKDRIVFPEERHHRSQSTGRSLEMEIALAQELSQFENVEDIISRIHGVPEVSVGSRIGGEERSNAERPKVANCAPELHPVSLSNSSVTSAGPSIPSCTRVLRCGGCCGHASLSCEPTETVTRHFEVIVSEYDTTGLSYRKREIVPIVEHIKCACGCKTKAEHCNNKQQYLPKECRCACTNFDEETKCGRNNDTKLWDENSCVCRCRGSSECTSGSYYDDNTCSCRIIRLAGGRRQVLGQAQRRYSSGPARQVPPVYVVSADDPRRRSREDPEP